MGGQAIGLEAAGFQVAAAVEIDPHACETLRVNRPAWRVIEADIREIDGADFRGIDLFAGGVPCPPFSIAGKQLGNCDERDLFPEALRIIEQSRPPAILLENVPGFAMARFAEYRHKLLQKLEKVGYHAEWRILSASSFGVSQLRPRFVLVAMKPRAWELFSWPLREYLPVTVGDALIDLMRARGWTGAEAWRRKACGIAPTIVGGSKKHGGPDLGPTRARKQWASLGVDGLGIADEAPDSNFPISSQPRLTVRMVARLQGIPDDWKITGGKTAAYRQVGNAFPPPVARAVAFSIADALSGKLPQFSQNHQTLLFTSEVNG